MPQVDLELTTDASPQAEAEAERYVYDKTSTPTSRMISWRDYGFNSLS